MNNLLTKYNTGGEQKMYPRLLLVTPYAMAEHLNDVLAKIHRWGEAGNSIRKKRVLVVGEVVKRHFDYLPKDDLTKVVNEWDGQEIFAYVIATCPDNAQEELMQMVYISPDEKRAERDLRLWFPELFIE